MKKGFSVTILFSVLFMFLSSTTAFAQGANWQGVWQFEYQGQDGTVHGGNLVIDNCDQAGCDYLFFKGSVRGTCESEGRFSFVSADTAVHQPDLTQYLDDGETCRLNFSLGVKGDMSVGSEGMGCRVLCGARAYIASEFERVTNVPRYSTSYDCSRASTRVEHTVCGDRELAELDRRLAGRYRAVGTRTDGALRQRLRSEQREWLQQRNQRCEGSEAVVSCLRQSYRQRLDALQGWQ